MTMKTLQSIFKFPKRKMFQKPSVNFYEAFRPVHLYSKLFGIACFSFKKTSSNKYKVFVAPLDLFLLTISSSFQIVMWMMYAVFTDILLKSLNSDKGPVLNYWWIFVLFVGAICPIGFMFWSISYRKKFEKVFNLFLKIDKRVSVRFEIYFFENIFLT